MRINASQELIDRYNIIKRLFETYTGLTVDGLSHGLCMTLASLELEASVRYERVYNDAFLSTASLEALIKQKGQVVPYGLAKKAEGAIYVTGVKDTLVPVNTKFEDPNGNVYITNNDRKIEEHSIIRTLTEDETDPSQVYVNISSEEYASGIFYINNLEKEGRLEGDRYYFSKEGLEDKLIPNEGVLPQVTLKFFKVFIPSESEEGGALYNKDKDTELTLRTFVEGVTPSARIASMIKGEDAESYESYLAKCIKHDREPNAYFTTTSIRNLVLNTLPNILFLQTEAGTDQAGGFGRGKLRLYVCDNNYQLESDVENEVRSLVNEIRPANMSEDDIDIKIPTIKPVTIEIKGLNPSFEAMRAMIKKNLDDFFRNNLFFSVAVSSKQIERVIYDSVVNGTKVIDFTLESGGYVQQANTLLRLVDPKTDVSFT